MLVRQKPGSGAGKRVLFIAIEDETGIANLVIWPDNFERQRRLVMSAGLIDVKGRILREGEVVLVVPGD